MRLFFAEIRKLLSSKAIAVIFAVLLLADFALTLYTAKTEPVVGATAKAYEVYLQDPAYYQAYFEALEAERESMIRNRGNRFRRLIRSMERESIATTFF
jgi:uncharacterized protein YdbL (DUF1318 family)